MTLSSSAAWIRTEKLGRAPCEHCGEMLDVSEFHIFERIACPGCERATTVPGKLGNYDLLRELGSGGMGAVFLARDTTLQRKVALKVLNAKFGQDPVFVDSLLREAKAAAAVNHRNLVHIYTFGQVNGQPYIVMELVDGIRLDQCIEGGKEQDEEGWLGILEQVCQGLAAAEAARIIHGDIKPANILLDERGVAKVSDFGIARTQGAGNERILGTPLYIAPEKARGQEVDARADQFSLGASFWHILAGLPPYTGKTPREVVLNRFEDDPPDLRRHAPHVSEATSSLLRRMMALDPADRFPDFPSVAREAAAIPRRMAEARRAQEEREQARRQAELDQRRRKRRLRILFAVGGAGLLLLCALLLAGI